ncbi:potassium-transporting ATPase subunit KdpC [Clavibacter nebraskensis]|uniref:Potassium-transporting ATPase KdpC subunit n=2 Tax=Clavibacter nebraskensis TaxID=31963 RepID=A0AAI8ZKB2_9MICO|nr:potassium-transporting ATPase subunit KdpC [Clavibacter nebraskensis]KXU19836.1 potassium transporter KtrA [Clavibacter nebraskensis]OAH17892.1 potassium transporter KtrA [Clavibacter nebraskensis]QGV67757.1 potassium-transporting ATPase subunit KdpC [Clavibacter nebraskensis]QGV70556.1 potassium-transporting ATPase subunit KdpC [Clavibacter nebraskensis]QGV73347.1 potassium-transporting ATPase subunit KdpC [Clavibacter nebraskensis]
MSSPRQSLRTAGVAVRAMAVLTVVLGVGYTAVVTGIGQLALPAQADGSLVSADGQVVGSSLIGQSFQDSDGAALPEWFQSRPSAAGDGYDASASSGSNLGPENDDLVSSIEDRKAAIAESDGVDPATIPADALTASASGLDPHISPEYAREQVARVAEARGIPEQQVERLVDEHVQGRDLGYLGEPTVNVLELNIALAGLGG